MRDSPPPPIIYLLLNFPQSISLSVPCHIKIDERPVNDIGPSFVVAAMNLTDSLQKYPSGEVNGRSVSQQISCISISIYSR
jgi:hypothetical protein